MLFALLLSGDDVDVVAWSAEGEESGVFSLSGDVPSFDVSLGAVFSLGFSACSFESGGFDFDE